MMNTKTYIKIISFIAIVVLSISCRYTSYEKNVNGVAEVVDYPRASKMLNDRIKTLTKDNKYNTVINFIPYEDTILQRPYTKKDLRLIKRVLPYNKKMYHVSEKEFTFYTEPKDMFFEVKLRLDKDLFYTDILVLTGLRINGAFYINECKYENEKIAECIDNSVLDQLKQQLYDKYDKNNADSIYRWFSRDNFIWTYTPYWFE